MFAVPEAAVAECTVQEYYNAPSNPRALSIHTPETYITQPTSDEIQSSILDQDQTKHWIHTNHSPIIAKTLRLPL